MAEPATSFEPPLSLYQLGIFSGYLVQQSTSRWPCLPHPVHFLFFWDFLLLPWAFLQSLSIYDPFAHRGSILWFPSCLCHCCFFWIFLLVALLLVETSALVIRVFSSIERLLIPIPSSGGSSYPLIFIYSSPEFLDSRLYIPLSFGNSFRRR